VPAEAVIEDDKVILDSAVESPEYVRYAWQPYTSANLVNGEGLPASTFFTTVSKN
jgi:sialate O-acetylesterase